MQQYRRRDRIARNPCDRRPCWLRSPAVKGTDSTDAPVEAPRLDQASIHLLPQGVDPVLRHCWGDLAQVQVRVVLITPLQVVPQLSAVPVLRLLTAGTAALSEESLDQQLIAPEDDTSLSGIEQTADKSQRLCLVHAVQDRRNFGNSFGKTAFLRD